MSIVSLNFLLFIAGVLFVYYIIPGRMQWMVLLVSNIIFFIMASGIRLSLVFAGMILLNWLGALTVEKLSDMQARKKTVYIAIVMINITLLVVFKDFNFFPDTLNFVRELFGYQPIFSRIAIAAPLGISYFTLILVSYITEVYWGKYPPQKNIGKFSLFAGYFPLMTSGPFVKYDQTGKCLLEKHPFRWNNIVLGSERILWGFFKKLVIAERLGTIVSTVYNDYSVYSGWYVLLAAAGFVLQLYADFSGAIDIALGVSECFGVALPENFILPFWSTSISEFWRRWHITLGAWLRKSVFYPLLRSGVFRKLKKWCRNKLGKDYEKKFNLPVYLGMLITWFLIGFWHGGRWNYIFGSGLYYWFLITIGEICMPLIKQLIRILNINTECSSYRLFQRVRTFCIFSFGLSFFRAASLRDGILMWRGVLQTFQVPVINNGTILGLGLDLGDTIVLIVALSTLIMAGLLRLYLQKSIREWFNQQNMMFKGSLIIMMLLGIIIFGIYGPGVSSTEFIYQQF